MTFLDTLLDGSLMPHGHCLLWRGDLLLLHVGGDALTVFSYFAIPPVLLIIRNRREDLPFDRLFLMFALFIFLCGVTHLISILNVWRGYYFIEGLAKMSTGLISALTAIVIWQLLPKILSVPSMAALITNSELLTRSKQELEAVNGELERVNTELERRIQERGEALAQIAIMDPLTGTFRRAYILERLGKELLLAKNGTRGLSVALLDMDDFATVNTRYGLHAADQILEQTGALLNRLSPGDAMLGRVGGEEFLLLLPEKRLPEATEIVQRLMASVTEHSYALEAESIQAVTLSAALIETGESEDTDAILIQLQEGLLRAKVQGAGSLITVAD